MLLRLAKIRLCIVKPDKRGAGQNANVLRKQIVQQKGKKSLSCNISSAQF